ncbi:Crp/Fnr family transcriptional regulator [Labilibacter sediminis]|nr:Crp/Fnr family transcriptional regulator [Labilibacter sediminis]
MLEKYPILEQSPLFTGLSFNDIKELLGQIHFQVKKYGKGQMVAYGGETVDRLHIVLSGGVKGEMIDYSGKSIKIEDIDPPKPLAIAFLFGKSNKYPVNIVANKDSEILIIPKASVLILFQKNETVLLNYLNAISNRSQFLSQKIRFLTFQTIKGKIANYLLQLSGGKTMEVTLPMSQNSMAELFGVTRPSVGRGMRELHNDGIIEANGKQVKLLDINALKESLK